MVRKVDTFYKHLFFGLNGVRMVCIMRTMKRDQRTIKIYDTSHTLAAKMSNRFGVSMAALVEIGLHTISKLDHLEIPARDTRGRKMNSRRALA